MQEPRMASSLTQTAAVTPSFGHSRNNLGSIDRRMTVITSHCIDDLRNLLYTMA